MSTQDTEDLQGRVGPFLTYVERVRPDGVVARWDSRRHRKHPPGAPATGLDVVGAPGPGMVDRGPVRRRARCCSPSAPSPATPAPSGPAGTP